MMRVENGSGSERSSCRKLSGIEILYFILPTQSKNRFSKIRSLCKCAFPEICHIWRSTDATHVTTRVIYGQRIAESLIHFDFVITHSSKEGQKVDNVRMLLFLRKIFIINLTHFISSTFRSCSTEMINADNGALTLRSMRYNGLTLEILDIAFFHRIETCA